MPAASSERRSISQENVGRGMVIAASTLPEFIRQAVDAYGSIRAAADGIGVPYSTLRDWLCKQWPASVWPVARPARRG